MRMPAFIRLTIRNIRVNTDPGTMFFMLGLPAFYFVVLGVMFQGLIPYVKLSGESMSYTQFLAPGIVGMQAFTAGNIGGGMLWSDRRWGMFEQLMVGPFRRTDYLLGIVSVSIIFALGGSGIMIVLADAVSGGFSVSFLSGVYLVLALVGGTILFSSLFLALSILVRTMQAYNTLTILLFFILDFGSTAFYPVTSQTPEALRILSMGNPLSYVVNVVRDSMVLGITSTTTLELGLVAVVMLALFGGSLGLYRKIKTGL